MANVQNLKPIKKGDLSKEELKKRQSNGGKKSAEARRERKLIKDRILERIGEADWDTMIDNLIDRAKDSPKDFEILFAVNNDIIYPHNSITDIRNHLTDIHHKSGNFTFIH